MPNAPLTARVLLWQQLDNGEYQVVDWYLVTTSLGDMVESRTVVRLGDDIQNEDLRDSAYTAIQKIAPLPTGNYALDQLAYGAGSQWPHYRASDPGVDMP